MKVYLVTEVEMQALIERIEKAFRQKADRYGERWNTSFADEQKPSIYDNFKAANFEICRWKGDVS